MQGGLNEVLRKRFDVALDFRNAILWLVRCAHMQSITCTFQLACLYSSQCNINHTGDHKTITHNITNNDTYAVSLWMDMLLNYPKYPVGDKIYVQEKMQYLDSHLRQAAGVHRDSALGRYLDILISAVGEVPGKPGNSDAEYFIGEPSFPVFSACLYISPDVRG